MESEGAQREEEQFREMELDAADRLEHIATQLTDARGIEALYEQILDTARTILHADFASLQMFYPERVSGGELRLVGHRAFSAEAVKRWERVRPTTRTICGEALRTRQRIAIADLRNSDFIAGSEDPDGYLSAGILAVQSTPLTSQSGALLGVVSTHWREPHEMSVSELRALDVLARRAGDLIEHSRGEEALRRSEELFSRAMKNMGEGLYTLDKEGLVTYINPAAERMFGWTSAELSGKKMHDVIHYKHPDGSPFPASECAGSRVLQEGNELHGHEDDFIRKDGSFFPVVYSCSPLINGGGTSGLVVVFRDDTERQRAQRALRESEELFRVIFSHAGVGISLTTPDGVLLAVNSHSCQMLGYAESELRMKPYLEITHADDRENCRSAASRLLAGDIPSWQGEKRYIHKNGNIVWVSVYVSLVRDEHNQPKYFVGVAEDVTARKQAEAALRESEQQYKEIFDNFSECIFVLDVTADARFKFAGLNPAEEKATGLSSSEVSGKFVEEVFAGEFAKPLIAHYRSCLEAGTIIQYDDELTLPSGTRFFHTNLIPVRDGDGRIQRIVGCCMDFTDLKRAQQEAFAMQKLESVGTLASGIAHDFNNLLGGVLAQADLASVELAAGLDPEEELKRIREVAIHGSEIVRQLMIYAGKETVVLELVDVSRIVSAMIELLKVSVSKHAALQTDLENDLRAVRASGAQLRQIVMNLVTNASEAIGDRDGVIRVSTRCVTVDRDWSGFAPRVLAEGDYLQLEVSDTGPGMLPEIQARVLDPFFTTKSAGRGLGLAVVQGIVRSLRGAIHLKSEPGKGTTVQILLPCAETTVETTNGPVFSTEGAAPPSQQGTVLVVEDEETLRQAVTKMLRRGGFSVIEATDGFVALEAIRAHKSPIDILFLDLTLPGTPSREIFDEAKRLRPEMSVIVTSAYNEDKATEMLRGTVERFIRKPYRIGDLMELVRHTLS